MTAVGQWLAVPEFAASLVLEREVSYQKSALLYSKPDQPLPACSIALVGLLSDDRDFAPDLALLPSVGLGS